MDELRIHTILEHARHLSEEGKALHAAQLYRRLLTDDPQLVEPVLLLASLYTDQGHCGSAEKLLRGGLRRHPRHPALVLMLGDLCAWAGRYPEAVQWYATLRVRRMPQVHFRLGSVYLSMGALHNAAEEFRATLRRDSHFPRAHEMLGDVLLRSGVLDQALQQLQCAVALEPYSAAAHRLLGVALLRLHRPAEALETLILAVDLDPSDAIAWRLCGEVLTRLRRYEEAEFYVKRAQRLDPASPDTEAALGFLCLHRGNAPAALEAFNSALSMQPGHSRALDGRLHAKLMTEQAWTSHDSGSPASS